MSKTSNGGRLSIAAVVSAVMLAGTLTPASAIHVEEPTDEPSATIQPGELAPSENGEDPGSEPSPTEASTSEGEPQPVDETPRDPQSIDSAEADEGQPDPAPTSPVETHQTADDLLIHEDFSSDDIPAGWEPIAGNWRVDDGRLLGTSASNNEQARIVFGEHFEHYRFEATLRFDSAANTARWTALGLDMPTDASENWQQAAMRVDSSAHNGLEFAQRLNAGWSVTDVAPAPRANEYGEDVTIAVEVSGNRGKWYFEDELIMETNQLRRTTDGVLGLVVNNSTVSFDEVSITEIEPFPAFDTREPGETAAIVAHRGDSSVAPENTMAAVTSAVEGGTDFFEIDINFTADNEIVAIHDSTVDRTTDGTGTVREMTYAEISELDAGSWLDPSYSYAEVPKLEEVLDYMSDSGAQMLLEYKDDWTPEQVDMTAELVEEYDVADQIIAQSFDLTTVESLQQELPEVPRMILGSPGDNFEEVADNLDAIGWNPSGNYLQQNPDWVERAHAADLATFVYTINDAAHWEQLTALGVDGIITDHPGQLNGWNQRYAAGDPESGEIASIVAHRGNSGVAPENTMPGIASAAFTGAEYFEIDIEYTSDDVVVAIHDGTVDQTTDGVGRVRDMTYEQINELDAGSWFAGGHGYSGVGVPTFEEVLEHMVDSEAQMLLEYKSTWAPEKVQLTRELIEKYDVADQIIVQSFDLTTVENLQAELPEVPRMILGAPRLNSEEIAANLGAVAWNPSVSQVLTTAGWVDRMHDAGLETYVYTVNSARQWEQLTALGVDGIITDYPDHLRGWNARFAQVVDQPEPSEPEPSETPSTEPTPTETPSTEPSPSESESPEPKPSETASTEPTPSESEPSDPEPSETESPEPTPTIPDDEGEGRDNDENGEEVVGSIIVTPAEVLPGGEVTVEADGFEAGEDVEITLNPTLATVQADANGSFSEMVTIPKTIEPGEYQLTVTGLASGNWGEVALTVLQPVASDVTTEQPTADPVESTGEVRGELATTGASTTGIITVAALIMLLVGMMLVIVHRRRQATAID